MSSARKMSFAVIITHDLFLGLLSGQLRIGDEVHLNGSTAVDTIFQAPNSVLGIVGESVCH